MMIDIMSGTDVDFMDGCIEEQKSKMNIETKETLSRIIERLEGKKIRPLGTGLEEGINKGLNIAISIILEDMEGDR